MRYSSLPRPTPRKTYILDYGDDEEISATLPPPANMRVIRGGDATVNRLRSAPLPPDSKAQPSSDSNRSPLTSAPHCLKAGEVAPDSLASPVPLRDSYSGTAIRRYHHRYSIELWLADCSSNTAPQIWTDLGFRDTTRRYRPLLFSPSKLVKMARGTPSIRSCPYARC
jgi:hypothetical protein